MPYVNVRITDENVSAEQKLQIMEEITQTLVRVLNKNPQTTHIVIDEIPTDNWGIGGEPVTQRRKAGL